MWDWADPKVYLHDEIASDKRNPTVNANGPIYGALEESADYLPVVDPTRNTREPGQADGSRSEDAELRRTRRRPQPSPYWGDEAIWNSQTTVAQLRDGQAGPRVGRGAHPQNADAGVVPGGLGSSVGRSCSRSTRAAGRCSCTIRRRSRSRPIDTCFSTGPRELRRQRRAVVVVRAGRRRGLVRHEDLGQDARREEGAGLDARSSSTPTATASATRTPSPISRSIRPRTSGSTCRSTASRRRRDGSVWGSVQGMPGALVRLVPGLESARDGALRDTTKCRGTTRRRPRQGFAPRGMDVDSKGVVWTVLSSGQLASFDRRKCKGPLNGPTATGQHCPEGWTLYPLPGPELQGRRRYRRAPTRRYYNFVDRFDMLGVGKDVPLATGNLSEGLLALVDGKFLTLRVPYPMGFFAKGMDGRIDNPNGGWKGKGIYTTVRDARAVPHGRRQGERRASS